MTGSNFVASILSPYSGTVVTGRYAAFTCYAASQNRQVTGVELFANGFSIGQAQKSPGSRNWLFTWTNAIPGTNQIVARATDSSASITTSLPVQLRMNQLAPIMLSFSRNENQLTLSWAGAGFKLQYSDSLWNGAWADVTGGTNSPVTVSIISGDQFYRLLAQ
jgi:hypothetical protein